MADLNRLRNLAAAEAYVEVTGFGGDTWRGRLTALIMVPSMIVEAPDGTRMYLPQSFDVAEIEEPPAGTRSEYVTVRRDELERLHKGGATL